jgi:uncharacterized protein (TIGR02466 family)
MDTIQLFPTSIALLDFSDDPDLPLLNRIIEQSKTDDHYLVIGAKSSYATDKPLLNNPLLHGIKSRITAAANDFANTLGLHEIQMSNSWFNIMTKGQYVTQHRHELSVVSGAFYTHAEEGACSLIFHNPLGGLRMYEVSRETNELNGNHYFMPPPRAGQLVLFPGWLEHSTMPNDTDRRVVVSFNTCYKTANAYSR